MRLRRTICAPIGLALIVCALVLAAGSAGQPRRALARLTRSLGPLPNGAVLAGTPPPSRRSPASNRIEEWPAEAVAAVAALRGPGRTRDAVRVQAAVDLFLGNAAAAAARLERTLRSRPRDASLLNDTAAAYLVLAAARPESAALYLSHAIERATAAAEIRPDWSEPAQNRLAAVTALGIADASREGQLQAPRPVQIEDALGYDARACDAAARQSAQATRELLEVGLASSWAEHDEPAAASLRARHLDAFACLARARLAAFDDRFFIEAEASLRRAGGAARPRLAAAHLAYVRGRALYDAGRRNDAEREFLIARDAFAELGSPFQHEAALQITIVCYQRRDLAVALDQAERLRRIGNERRYPALAARATWILGLARMQRAAIEEAVEALDDARDRYERLREPENVVSVANTTADTLRITGDATRGWTMLTIAARSLPSLASPQRRYLALFNLSLYAQDEGLWRAAEVYQSAAVAAADERGQILTMIESRLRRAQLSLRRRSSRAARAEIDSASRMLATVTDQTSLNYLAAWRDRLLIELDEPRDPARASRAFESLVAPFETIEPAEVPSLFLQAGRAARAAADLGRATGLFRRGIAVATERRKLLATDEYRITHFSTNWDLYHELIDVEVDLDARRGLITADQGRAALASRETPTDVAALPLSLPEGEAVFYYAALRDRLVVWIVGAGQLAVKSVRYPAGQLAEDVAAFRDAIDARDRQGSAAVGRTLFRKIVAPAIASAPGVRRLLIAPDGPLGDLPFALLPDDRSSRFLIEGYEIAYVPILSSLARGDVRRPTSVLAIGYNGAVGGEGPRLETAESEARAIAEPYSDRSVLAGREATPAALGSRASGRDVIHVAAHAETNRLAPWLSFVRLAPASTALSSGILRFGAATAWDLRRCVLVVLSACDTATGSRVRAFGTVNLAGPFLSAGAGAVAGTLWRIDDRGAAMFTPLFHRQVAAGVPAITALRQAQLEALQASDPVLNSPQVWGAWVLHTRELPR